MIVFDVETTGLLEKEAAPLEKQPQIIEFAAVKLDDVKLKEVDRMSVLINPGIKLPPEIIKITGLMDGDLKGEPTFPQILPTIITFFLGERMLVAHNVAFDTGCLRHELRRLDLLTRFPWPPEQVCTVEATMSLRGYRLNLDKLHQELFKKAPEGKRHRAMADVEFLVKIVRELRKRKML